VLHDGRWQPDKEVSHCPLCNSRFSHTFRKHHCRQCGRVVCETCSPSRLRLPKLPKEGKVRVCTPCVTALGERQATGFEEDLAAYEESIVQLRNADRELFSDCEIYKRVLLELDAEASGNMSLVEEHFLDPDTALASFALLKDRAQKQWAGLLDARVQEKVHHQELLDRYQDSLQRVDQARQTDKDLKVRKAELMAELRVVDKVQAERDALARRETELDKAVVAARKRVQELELQRKAHQERQQQQAASGQERRWRPFSFGRIGQQNSSTSPPRSSSGVSSPLMVPPSSEPEAFTITAGQPAVQSQSRVDGCRRRCVVM